MKRLSSPLSSLRPHYTAVIVGSGYGGGIAASRLARAGKSVCVLERGKEFQLKEFPNTLEGAIEEMQAYFAEDRFGPRTGLYDLRVNENINVLVGCGLGGTSLINANVSLRAEPVVFQDHRWPREIRDEAGAGQESLLETCYRRAEYMLQPTMYPQDFPELLKLSAHEKSARALGEDFYRAPINVTFEDGLNHAGVEQSKCVLCGDCVSGCNYGAKNTVQMNYLPDAHKHGTAIFTETSVTRVEPSEGGWRVHFEPTGADPDGSDASNSSVSTDIVVLAAGCLGSTEILLRSRDAGLALSAKVGHGFTGNGDVLAFGYNCDQPINGVGFGVKPPGEIGPVGPTITGVIDTRQMHELKDGMVIEEGAIPGALASILPATLAAAALLFGRDTDRGIMDRLREWWRVMVSKLRGAYYGATHDTQTYLVMTHDDAGGRIFLENDRVRVDWPDIGRKKIFKKVGQHITDVTRTLSGTYIPNPIWTKLFDHQLITVHPLGGCAMAEDAAAGVVNHKGQVFSGETGGDTYDGLYVCDGAIIPCSLGVNPLLTISALAERCCVHLLRDHGWGEVEDCLPELSA